MQEKTENESLIKNTNLDISEEDQKEEDINEIEEFFISKGNYDSGTNVGDELAKYVKTIPEAHKCLNLTYWNILELTKDTQINHFFSTDDWEEINKSFKKEVKLVESDISDRVDRSIAMRWIHETYGMACKVTNVLRLGRLSQKKMPNTLKTLAILEGFYATMSDIKSTLKIICNHKNNVSRSHRKCKRKIPVYSEQSGLFGTPSSPIKKSKR
ncbi:20299_t:CDS:2 [Cetraspora pellucida]|uniref:20299_t:CDS:1 n=1 Tax=Cetraspora pellucida TaxID=1433469 RepID=A0A9N8WAT9_9GLOM|nr:20299_t:CDS:2 [Cetraspora pellucida]